MWSFMGSMIVDLKSTIFTSPSSGREFSGKLTM